MTLTLAMIGGIAAVALAAVVTPGNETASSVPVPVAAEPRGDWHLLNVTSLSDAEHLLDHLEATGSAERELVILGDSHFAVRWR